MSLIIGNHRDASDSFDLTGSLRQGLRVGNALLSRQCSVAGGAVHNGEDFRLSGPLVFTQLCKHLLHCEPSDHIVKRVFRFQCGPATGIVLWVERWPSLETVAHLLRPWYHVIFVFGVKLTGSVLQSSCPCDL